jgi:hypothetical protein
MSNNNKGRPRQELSLYYEKEINELQHGQCVVFDIGEDIKMNKKIVNILTRYRKNIKFSTIDRGKDFATIKHKENLFILRIE